jgi:hypothetical protein
MGSPASRVQIASASRALGQSAADFDTLGSGQRLLQHPLISSEASRVDRFQDHVQDHDDQRVDDRDRSLEETQRGLCLRPRGGLGGRVVLGARQDVAGQLIAVRVPSKSAKNVVFVCRVRPRRRFTLERRENPHRGGTQKPPSDRVPCGPQPGASLPVALRRIPFLGWNLRP